MAGVESLFSSTTTYLKLFQIYGADSRDERGVHGKPFTVRKAA